MSITSPTHYAWDRLVIDEIGVMSTLQYRFGNPDEPLCMMVAWHDLQSLDCPCGGPLFVYFNEVHQAYYPSQEHLLWTGQRCPADRIDELRRLMDLFDHHARQHINEMQLVPFPDNPQI